MNKSELIEMMNSGKKIQEIILDYFQERGMALSNHKYGIVLEYEISHYDSSNQLKETETKKNVKMAEILNERYKKYLPTIKRLLENKKYDEFIEDVEEIFAQARHNFNEFMLSQMETKLVNGKTLVYNKYLNMYYMKEENSVFGYWMSIDQTLFGIVTDIQVCMSFDIGETSTTVSGLNRNPEVFKLVGLRR